MSEDMGGSFSGGQEGSFGGGHSRVGPGNYSGYFSGGSSPNFDEEEKRRKKFMEELKKFGAASYFGKRIPGMDEQTITLPGQRGRFVGKFTPFSNEGGPDSEDGTWGWSQDYGSEQYYDPTMPKGYSRGQAKSEPTAPFPGLDIASLIGLIGQNSGRQRTPAPSIKYGSGMPGYSSFLG